MFRRDKVIFRVDQALPDPEVQKFRFRRRVLLLTVLGLICVLSFTTLKDRLPALEAHSQARSFATLLLEARSIAQKNGHSQLLVLRNDKGGWLQEPLTSDKGCAAAVAAHAPEVSGDQDFYWRALIYQKDQSQELKTLCFDAYRGVFANSNQLSADQIVTIAVGPRSESERADRLRYIIVSQSGDSIRIETP